MSDKEIFNSWKDAGYFSRTEGFGPHKNEGFTVVIPPRNITGVLHMGHALNDSIQDSIVRHARMQGYKTRWVLGTDHAGIATQTKVDKHLADQGINRREIGRSAFIEECQKWRREFGTTIVNQIKEMGCSVDYDNENFTMSDEFSRAVRRVFVDWYKRGLIYRGKRVVNWCPHCTTAIADDEAEYEPEKGHLWYMRYPLKEPVDGIEYVTVATTRPETMLGDTGVAVSPKDERFKNLVGKTLILPIVNREIPIFDDFYVDAEFGTGCVKVTPAHDPNDYAMGNRHDLERINIFDQTAHVVEGYGKFSGMSALEAREAIVEEFDNLGLLDHIEDLDHSVMHCYRCHTTLEPWLSEQWFVDVETLKVEARKVVEQDEVKFYPNRWKNVYLDWLENLKDWCISRQLWWGHQIPMYYCDECGWMDASEEHIDKCPKCGADTRQDEDVLDTWFSSQLWPFGTLGWANDTTGAEAGDLQEYYPTQVLSTARDIMGLWVARMVMASMDCIGKIPFYDILIHPTVMGADGKPMSKSRGNGVNPLDLIRDYGADAMRFGLLSQVTGTQAIRFDYQKIESSRNFANKIRNAAKFVCMNLDGFDGEVYAQPNGDVDNWILSRLATMTENIDKMYETYEFSEITRELYSFIWNEFCDWYIEFSKPRLNGDDEHDKLACQRNLVFVLDQAIRLLHPIMPFITEEVYGYLDQYIKKDCVEGNGYSQENKYAQHLIMCAWPDISYLSQFKNEEAAEAISTVCQAVGAVRSIRARYGISPKTNLNIAIKVGGVDVEQLLKEQVNLILNLANISDIVIGTDTEKPAQSAVVVAGPMEIFICLEGLVDLDAEKKRLLKQLESVKNDHAKFDKKLSNPGFLNNAKPEIIEKDKKKLADLSSELERLETQLKEFD